MGVEVGGAVKAGKSKERGKGGCFFGSVSGYSFILGVIFAWYFCRLFICIGVLFIGYY